jgi:hypothetical protein
MSILGDDVEDFGHGGGSRHAQVSAILGALAEVIGVAPPRGGGHSIQLHKPDWRKNELAPGVEAPDEGMHPLPLTPLQNNGVFANSTNGGPTSITYQGQMQVPFRGERMFVNAGRINTGGTAANAKLLAQMFVGIALQQAEIFGIDIETIGGATTFGSRMTMRQAPPGVLMRALVTETAVPTNPDVVTLAVITLMGRVYH